MENNNNHNVKPIVRPLEDLPKLQPIRASQGRKKGKTPILSFIATVLMVSAPQIIGLLIVAWIFGPAAPTQTVPTQQQTTQTSMLERLLQMQAELPPFPTQQQDLDYVQQPTQPLEEHPLIGEWGMFGVWGIVPGTYWTFNADGTGLSHTPVSTDTFSWRVNGDRLYVTNSITTHTSVRTISIVGNYLDMTLVGTTVALNFKRLSDSITESVILDAPPVEEHHLIVGIWDNTDMEDNILVFNPDGTLILSTFQPVEWFIS